MLTPAERKHLINKPFPIVRTLPHSYRWAGVLIGDRFYGDGERKLFLNTTGDNSHDFGPVAHRYDD